MRSLPSFAFFSISGWVWPEYLARRMGVKLRDYATGSATTDNALNPAVLDLGVANITVPSALDQVAAYLAENTTTPESLATSLHIIFTGGNDALAVLQEGLNITGQQLTDAVARGVSSLQAAGAAAITLVNLPSLDDTPASRDLTVESSQALDVLTSSYRTGLQGLESANVTNADPYQAVNALRANAEAYGFNSTTFVTPCQVGLSALEQSLGFQYTKCKDQDSHVFWDSVRPAREKCSQQSSYR
jgi:phospholipase/lecithinase/hemolysin